MERTLSPTLKDNILVCGGTTKFSGFGPRLEKELDILNTRTRSSSSSSPYSVHYVDNPLLAAWIGGSVISSISSFCDQWITIDTYAEVGSKIVHKVCFWYKCVCVCSYRGPSLHHFFHHPFSTRVPVSVTWIGIWSLIIALITLWFYWYFYFL